MLGPGRGPSNGRRYRCLHGARWMSAKALPKSSVKRYLRPMTRVIILTGVEPRHDFVRKAIALSEGLRVLRSYCEGEPGTAKVEIDNETPGADRQEAHLAKRLRSERDFFGPFVRLVEDRSHPLLISVGAINDQDVFDGIRALEPDLVLAYGCSIVRDPLLGHFPGRFLNVHLGLSPYYRGSGTNFWALVNGEPEFVGATFMHMARQVDAGEIIHQIRARVYPGDTPHQIGNRLICDMAETYAELASNFDDLSQMPQLPPPQRQRHYRRRDFSPEAVTALYDQFSAGMIERYLGEEEARHLVAPIIVNDALRRADEDR